MNRCPSTTRAIRRYLASVATQHQLRSHAAAMRLIEILDAQPEFCRQPPKTGPRTGSAQGVQS